MNPEEQDYQEPPVYQEPGQEYYYEDEVGYEQRVQPVFDISALQIPFWIKVSFLCVGLMIMVAMLLFSNYRYQGFQMTQVQTDTAPAQNNNFFNNLEDTAPVEQNDNVAAASEDVSTDVLQPYDNASFYLDVTHLAGGSREIRLMYNSEKHGDTNEAAILLGNPMLYDFYLSGRRLYYVGVDRLISSSRTHNVANQIFYIDMNTFEQGVLERPDNITHSQVGSIFVYGDHLYYLSGDLDSRRCIDGPSRDCLYTLNKMSLSNPAQVEALSTSSPANTFIGYSGEQDAMFMYTGYADAGCIGIQMYIYERQQVYIGPELGGCVDNMTDTDSPELAQYRAEMAKLEADVKPQSGNTLTRDFGRYSVIDSDTADSYVDFYLAN